MSSPTHKDQRKRNRRRRTEAQLAAVQEVLRVSEARYRTAFETSLDAIAICRMDDGMFVDVNRTFFDILGYTRDELVGQTSSETCVWIDAEGKKQSREFLDVSGRSSRDLMIWDDFNDWERLTGTLRKHSICRDFEARLRKKDGSIVWTQIAASVIELEAVPCVLFVVHDVTLSKAAEDRIRNLSYYDTLTGLPNRSHLLDRLRQRTAEKSYRALLSINLDHFKSINDSMGHTAGDLLLQESASRISSCIRDLDTAARVSADEFAALLKNLGQDVAEAAIRAQDIAQRILTVLNRPYLREDRECRCTASIGITLLADHSFSAEEAIQQVNIALGDAKQAGGNTIRFFAPELQVAASARAAMEADLHCAIGTDQLLLYYQPQFEDSDLIGAEALIRWRHPELGFLSPGKFIPLAEKSGLILPLGDWLLQAACRQVSAWTQSRQRSHFRIAVNISAEQFRQPDFVGKTLEVFYRTGVSPHCIELEITESTFAQDLDGVVARMSELKAEGLTFSIDDFGTGYSCLSYLKRLPIDKLKIDISFVREILVDESSQAIAQAIISLCHTLELRVIAEGVETREQRDRLAGMGCHCFQGYYFSPPVPPEQFESFFRSLPKNDTAAYVDGTVHA